LWDASTSFATFWWKAPILSTFMCFKHCSLAPRNSFSFSLISLWFMFKCSSRQTSLKA
jgi:hypothetical protein